MAEQKRPAAKSALATRRLQTQTQTQSQTQTQTQTQELLRFIDASPSPWHAVANTARQLVAAGFTALDETQRWALVPGGKYFVSRDAASLIAFVIGTGSPPQCGLRLVGAHTDSPGLRLKPRAAHNAEGIMRLAVEVYGGPILASFADRDLGLSGRIVRRHGTGIEACLFQSVGPVARLSNLAIHMNREVNEAGLKFNKQTELPLLFCSAHDDPAQHFSRWLATHIDTPAADILSWDIVAHDTQPAAFWGPEHEFIAARGLDNLASCHAGLCALLATQNNPATCLLGLFDHEEVGSTSAAGADGSFMRDVIERLVPAQQRAQTLAASFFISADMAHAWQPNFPAAYEPGHHVLPNAGPVIKHNCNQRYSTTALTAARFMRLCEAANVPCQTYTHRTDLGCGSTIGPLLSASLGIASVDVGNPMWAMHSARESAGAADHASMIKVLKQHFCS